MDCCVCVCVWIGLIKSAITLHDYHSTAQTKKCAYTEADSYQPEAVQQVLA